MGKIMLAAFAALFLLAGCKKEIKLEVKQLSETEQNPVWEINIQRPVFSTTEASVEASCVKFNDKITEMIAPMQDSIRVQAERLKAELAAIGDSLTGPFQLYVRDSVYMADENYISVRLLVYVMTGGAHGNTNFYGLNYNVKTQEFLTDKEVIDFNKSTEINKLLAEHFVNRDSCLNELPTVETLSAVNFTMKTVDFTYAQYVLGAYACGYAQVAVPLHQMKGAFLPKW